MSTLTLVSRSHMWHGGRGRLLWALLRRGIVWTSSSELSEVALELSASASGFAVGPSGIGRIHSSSLDDSSLLLLANGFVFRAGWMFLTWRGVPLTSTACSLMMPVIRPLQKLVVHRLLGGFTQTVSPNSYGPICNAVATRHIHTSVSEPDPPLIYETPKLHAAEGCVVVHEDLFRQFPFVKYGLLSRMILEESCLTNGRQIANLVGPQSISVRKCWLP